MTTYAIEGRNSDGQWSEDSVICFGSAGEVNRFDSRDEADEMVEELAAIFECPTSDLRIVSVEFAQ